MVALPAPLPAPTCAHCGLAVAEPGARFCCAGCEAVFGLLHREGLDRYYDLGAGEPVASLRERDDPRTWLVPLEAELAGGATQLRLDIQGLHCAACVWLLEELFRRQPGALRLDVNPALGTLALTVEAGFPLRDYVIDVERFGYRLGPALKVRTGSSSLLWRLGVCVALAMNTMIFAVAVYAGLEVGPLRRVFDAIVFALATASVVIGGSVFIRSAVTALRRGILHLDLPIALGVVLAYASSTAAWLTGSQAIYLDTLTVFIALMLLGRFLQERVLERNRRQLLDSDGAEGLWTRRIAGDTVELCRVTSVRAGDQLLIAPGDLVPVEAVLHDEEATCRLDWISGESAPRRFVRDEHIPAGAFNADKRALRVSSASDFAGSALTELLRSGDAHAGEEARATGWWRRLARVYVISVLAVAGLSMAGWYFIGGDGQKAISVGAALLIVTCPCAFGIATPLAYELVQAGLRRAGLFVRRPGFLDRALAVRRVVFDKTGTLTTGALRLVDRAPLDRLSADERDIAYTLAASSTHPKSAAVRDALAGSARFRPELVVCERAGVGVEADGYRLGAPGDLSFSRHGRLLASLATEETPRADAAREIAALVNDGYRIDVLSGDLPSSTRVLAARMGLAEDHAHGGVSPAGKAEWLALHDQRDTLMIGDGLNDAFAVEQAFCSGTPAIDRPFLPARADFYFTTPGLAPIRTALRAARRLAGIHRRNLTIAVAYNVLSIALAAAGLMSPLLCAVLMPVASLTVVLTTALSLSRRSPLWKS